MQDVEPTELPRTLHWVDHEMKGSMIDIVQREANSLWNEYDKDAGYGFAMQAAVSELRERIFRALDAAEEPPADALVDRIETLERGERSMDDKLLADTVRLRELLEDAKAERDQHLAARHALGGEKAEVMWVLDEIEKERDSLKAQLAEIQARNLLRELEVMDEYKALEAQLSTARREVRREAVEVAAKMLCENCSRDEDSHDRDPDYHVSNVEGYRPMCDAYPLWRWLSAQEAAEGKP